MFRTLGTQVSMKNTDRCCCMVSHSTTPCSPNTCNWWRLDWGRAVGHCLTGRAVTWLWAYLIEQHQWKAAAITNRNSLMERCPICTCCWSYNQWHLQIGTSPCKLGVITGKAGAGSLAFKDLFGIGYSYIDTGNRNPGNNTETPVGPVNQP
jgi:hypothetical protein